MTIEDLRLADNGVDVGPLVDGGAPVDPAIARLLAQECRNLAYEAEQSALRFVGHPKDHGGVGSASRAFRTAASMLRWRACAYDDAAAQTAQRAPEVDPDDTTSCPLARVCAGCGEAGTLALAAIATPYGVTCLTICSSCVDRNALPHLDVVEAVELVHAHCGHLGITVDEMAAAMERGRR